MLSVTAPALSGMHTCRQSACQQILLPGGRMVSLSLSVSRFLSRTDTVTVSVWNNRKVHKKEGAGFLGCVRLIPATITQLRDTGCESLPVHYLASTHCFSTDQRLKLSHTNPDEEEMIRGQLICEFHPPSPPSLSLSLLLLLLSLCSESDQQRPWPANLSLCPPTPAQ